MADKIKVQNLPPYDGEYELGGGLTNREFHTIKRISGLRVGEIDEAFQAGDNDLIIAFTVIALQRAGMHVNEDILWDAETGKITYVFDGADAGPPDENQPASDSTNGGNQSSSGTDSGNDSGNPPNDPNPTGPESS